MDNNNLDKPAVVTAAAGSGTAAILVFAMMPVLVGGMADRFSLDDLQSGLIATTYFSTYAVIALTSPIWIRRWSWRTMTLLGFGIMLVSLGIALLADSFATARLAVAASGLGAGMLYPVSLTLVSDMEHTERVYAIKLAVEQLVPAGLLILLSLGVVFSGGLNSTLVAILTALILCFLASLAMPVRGSLASEHAMQPGASIMSGTLALIALSVNFAGFAGLWVFMERIAVERGFESEFINQWLAVGLITSGIGPLIAAMVADRLGRVRSVLISTGAALASMALLAGEPGTAAYALTLTLFPLTYYFGISYFFSIVAAADGNGRISGLMSFALAVGSATGPAIFGAVKSTDGPVLETMAVCIAAGAALIIFVAKGQRPNIGVSET